MRESVEQIYEYLKSAPGPMPWYYMDVPEIKGYSLKYNDKIGTILLVEDNCNDKCKLILNMYTRAFIVPPFYLGIWYETEYNFEILIFEPAHLSVIDSETVNKRINYKDTQFICNEKPLEHLNILKELSQDKMNIPEELKSIPEIFLIGGIKSAKADTKCAIYVLNTQDGSINTFPQYWFTAEDFDVGYQWITKAARHPWTKRIIGTGIRISDFILSEDGCNLDKWIGRMHWPWECVKPK